MINIFAKLDLPCIIQIASNLNDGDFVSFAESCQFIYRTFKNIGYLAIRCQESLNQLISNKIRSGEIDCWLPFVELNEIKFGLDTTFGLDKLFENIFNVAFLDLKQFPWRWFLDNLRHGNITFDKGILIIGKILPKDSFNKPENIDVPFKYGALFSNEPKAPVKNPPYNKVMCISSSLVCIGIQISDKIVGLRLSNNSRFDYHIYQCKDPRKLTADQVSPLFDVPYIANKYHEFKRHNLIVNLWQNIQN